MIRMGVIGLGARARGVLKMMMDVDPEVQVVGVVDPDEEGVRTRMPEQNRESPVFYRTLDALVRKAKPDGLLIGTRCNLHAPYAIQAARYDIPLFLEKPVAVTMRQATALERAFENSKCPVVVSFPLRVSPLCERTKQVLDQGAVGTREHVTAVNYVPYGTVYWHQGYRYFDITQGLFLQKATHDFDYLQYLMESPIVRVAAMANYGRVFGGNKPSGLKCSGCKDAPTCLESPYSRQRRGLKPINDRFCLFSKDSGTPETGTNEDCSSALVEFASGAHGIYTQVFFTRRDAGARGATISGYMGTVSFDWYKNELRHVRHHEPFTDVSKAGEGASHFGGDTQLVQDFLEVVKGTATSRTPIETGLASVYACLAAKRSAETGRFVKVRQVGA